MSNQTKVQEATVQLPDGVRAAREVDPQMVPYTDKRGRSREALTLFVDDGAIEYVSWDNWELLGRVFARCATDPAFAAKLAGAVRNGYVEHAGAANGANRRGRSLL